MDKRRLGNYSVSEIGMGCMGLSHGYGDIPSEEYSIEAIRKAYEAGCTFFDTAEGYGAELYGMGHNERILGKAIAPFRDKVVIATKFHFRNEEPIGRKAIEECIRHHLNESLKNLGVKKIDLYYLHRVKKTVPLESVAEAMGTFIKEGLIGGWGLSQVGLGLLKKANAVTPVTAVQNIYNMMERDAEKEVIPYCRDWSIAFVPFSPVGSGFLSGKVTPSTDFSHIDDVRKFVPQLSGENITSNEALLNLLSDFAERKRCTMAQISLAWMLHKYPHAIPIPGSKNQGRILENLAASEVRFSAGEFEELDSSLDKIEIHGHRGQEEYEGGSMADWGKKK